MAQYKSTFKCVILSPNSMIYENEVESVFVAGDSGEYELLAYHYPLLGVLKKSDVVINGSERVPINGGVLRFFANECVILIEEAFKKIKTKG